MLNPALVEDPTIALDPELWAIYGDFLEEQGNDSHLRARAISTTLNHNKGRLWLVVFPRGPLEPDFGVLSFVCCAGGHFDVLHSSHYYEWHEKVEDSLLADFRERYPQRELCPITPFDDPSVYCNRPDVITSYWNTLARLGGYTP